MRNKSLRWIGLGHPFDILEQLFVRAYLGMQQRHIDQIAQHDIALLFRLNVELIHYSEMLWPNPGNVSCGL